MEYLTNNIQVEIQADLEELEEREADMDDQDVFEIDPFDEAFGKAEPDSDSDSDGDDDLDQLSSEGEDLDDDQAPADIPANVKKIQEMVNKLDAVLKLLFDHFDENNPAEEPSSSLLSPLTSASNPPTPISTISDRRLSRRRAQFFTLLGIFTRTIIRTFKSRYTQFLLFWYTSLDPEYTSTFLGELVSTTIYEESIPPVPSVTRCAAASYIASFVSRALHVDRDTTRMVVGLLCAFLRNHLFEFDEMVKAGDGNMSGGVHHSIFYAVAQAVFLIFCFRWRELGLDVAEEEQELEDSPRAKKWMPELSILQRVIMSPLNPLKVRSFCAHL